MKIDSIVVNNDIMRFMTVQQKIDHKKFTDNTYESHEKLDRNCDNMKYKK